MEIIEYDSDLLIDFYKKNNLEINENRKYFGRDIKSYVLENEKKIVGAITFSKYNGINYIEMIAVDEVYRGKGYGKRLLDKVIDELKGSIYIISKNDKFFLDYGFKYDNFDLIDKDCKLCNRYNISCFPKVMIYTK